MPERIRRKRTRGWKMPENTVYVGRPSKWGNPFQGPDAVEKYRVLIEYIMDTGKVMTTVGRKTLSKEDVLSLHGKNLACWCSLASKCHADVLLEIANS
jgi:hypothetical protein